MAGKWAPAAVGLVGGSAVGLVLAVVTGSRMKGMSGYERWSDWILQGGLDYTLFTYPLGAALAGFLGTAALIRWRGVRSAILVVAASSLAGAIISVAGSVFLVCALWGERNMGCSGLGPLRIEVELPFFFGIFLVMTTTAGLLARRINRADLKQAS